MYRLYDLRRVMSGSLNIDLFTAKNLRQIKKAFALSGWLMTLLVLGIMFAVIGYAMYAGVWQSPVPEELYRRLIPQAPMIGH